MRLNTAVETGYVNCWEHHTRFQALYQVLDGIEPTLDIHRQSTPTDVLLNRIREFDEGPYVVILDEVDQLEDKSILYDLYRVRGLEMVLIANREEELFAFLDERVKSRLSGCERMHFSQYNLGELVAILSDRAHWGLADDAVDQGQIERIADAAAGDARTAIAILRSAARKAERNQLNQITEATIRDSIPEAKSEIRQADLDRLTPHQKILYDIIQKTGEVTPGDLYNRYETRVDDPKTKRTLRNYLDKMRQYNLLTANGRTKGRTYQVISTTPG